MMGCVVLCDLDGCVADNTAREKKADSVAKKGSPLWWNTLQDPKMVPTDVPVRYSAAVLRELAARGCGIFYLSGRNAAMKEATEWWLKIKGYPKGDVLLRPSGKSTLTFKAQWAHSLMANNSVDYAYDNDESVIAVYKKMGIPATLIRTKNADDWNKILLDLAFGQQRLP